MNFIYSIQKLLYTEPKPSFEFFNKLPKDLLFEVLTNVPEEEYNSLKRVCKLWYNVLKNITVVNINKMTLLELCKREKIYTVLNRKLSINDITELYKYYIDKNDGKTLEKIFCKTKYSNLELAQYFYEKRDVSMLGKLHDCSTCQNQKNIIDKMTKDLTYKDYIREFYNHDHYVYGENLKDIFNSGLYDMFD